MTDNRCENCQAGIPCGARRCTDCGADDSVSILSERTDGLGYHYGFVDWDPRQINIRREKSYWIVYVGGRKVGMAGDKGLAEQIGISWIKANPFEKVAERPRSAAKS